MSTAKKRTYNSGSRLEKAQINKNRLLSAARILFETKGFDQVTIEEIASASEVSAPTVYSLFKSKIGVLRAVIDEAMPPEQHKELVEKGKFEKSPVKRLALTARLSRLLYDAEKTQLNLLRGVSLLDPELKKIEQEMEQRRYQRQAESIKIMADEGVLGVPLSIAKDIFWAFTGRDLYRMLVIERGWTSDAYEKWLAKSLVKELLK